jgi:hypothetical protein
MPTVPIDGRKQFPGLTVMLTNHSMGRDLFAGVEQVGPDAYVVSNSWPAPKASSSFSSSVAASAIESAPVSRPTSSASALALWPTLK